MLQFNEISEASYYTKDFSATSRKKSEQDPTSPRICLASVGNSPSLCPGKRVYCLWKEISQLIRIFHR